MKEDIGGYIIAGALMIIVAIYLAYITRKNTNKCEHCFIDDVDLMEYCVEFCDENDCQFLKHHVPTLEELIE